LHDRRGPRTFSAAQAALIFGRSAPAARLAAFPGLWRSW
jgi:hypothetical protein